MPAALGPILSRAIDDFIQEHALELWTTAIAKGGPEQCVSVCSVEMKELEDRDRFLFDFVTGPLRELPVDIADSLAIDRERDSPRGKLLVIFIFEQLRITMLVSPPRSINSPGGGTA